jgi:hypothetical protein
MSFPGEFAGELFADKIVGDVLREHQIIPSEGFFLPEIFGINFPADVQFRPPELTPLTIEWRDVAPTNSFRRHAARSSYSRRQAELSKRDNALSRANAELSAAVEAMQVENAALRRALAVCREVGKAALAALRADPATVPGSRIGDTRLPGRRERFRVNRC